MGFKSYSGYLFLLTTLLIAGLVVFPGEVNAVTDMGNATPRMVSALLAGPETGHIPDSQDKEKKKHKKDSETAPEIIPGNMGQLIDAKKEMITGNITGARELFRKYVNHYPNDPVGYYELARIEAAMKNADEATRLAQEAVRLNPGNLWYSLFLAELYQLTGKTPAAVTIYEKIVQQYPENPDYRYQLAALYLDAGKFREAIAIYDQIEAKAGVSEDISIQKQKIYLHMNDLSSAEKEIRNLIAAFPGESRYYGILAEFYLANNMPEKALETYKKIKETDPDNAYIHMSMADYYRKTGDKDKAYEELKLGFSNPNLDVDTKVTILLSFYSVNQLYNDLKDQAFALATILVNTHPKDPKAWSIYGDLLTQDKKYTEARDAFIKVLTFDSTRYAIWEQVLRLDLQESQYAHLQSYGKRAIQLFPEQSLLYLFTGLASLQLKDNQDALNQFRTGSKLVADDEELLAQFYMYEGDALHALKDEEGAFRAYEKSLKLKGDNAYVLNNYAYYLSLRNEQLDKAETMAKKAVSLDPANASFLDTYGWVLFMKGKYSEAQEWIRKALDNEEEPSAEVLEHYGDVMYKLGKTEKANEYWQKAKAKGKGSDLLEKKVAERRYFP